MGLFFFFYFGTPLVAEMRLSSVAANVCGTLTDWLLVSTYHFWLAHVHMLSCLVFLVAVACCCFVSLLLFRVQKYVGVQQP
jgi:hypothetical protein